MVLDGTLRSKITGVKKRSNKGLNVKAPFDTSTSRLGNHCFVRPYYGMSGKDVEKVLDFTLHGLPYPKMPRTPVVLSPAFSDGNRTFCV
jgi:hypothetical protein